MKTGNGQKVGYPASPEQVKNPLLDLAFVSKYKGPGQGFIPVVKIMGKGPADTPVEPLSEPEQSAAKPVLSN